MRYPILPHHRLFLDALVAAVPWTILGLTSSSFIQAPALNWLGLGMLLVTLARAGFLGRRSYLLAHLSRRMSAETVLGYHRHLLGLPLIFRVFAGLIIIAMTWAYFVPPDGIPVVADVGGRIEKVCVTEGVSVHTGDPLVQLDTRDLLLRRAELEAHIHFTETRLAEVQRRTLATLYRDLEQTNLALDRLTITSPADGRIASLASLHSGEILSPGAMIATVLPTSR